MILARLDPVKSKVFENNLVRLWLVWRVKVSVSSLSTRQDYLRRLVPKCCSALSPPSTIYKQSSVTASKMSSVACHLWPCTHYKQEKQINSNLQIWKHMPVLLCPARLHTWAGPVKKRCSVCVQLTNLPKWTNIDPSKLLTMKLLQCTADIVKLGLLYETELSYDQVRERVCCQERSRGHAVADHINFISENFLWTEESQRRQSPRRGQTKYLGSKMIEEHFSVCCGEFINHHDYVRLCVNVEVP